MTATIDLHTLADFHALPPERRLEIRRDLARQDPAMWCRIGPHGQFGPIRPHAWQLDAIDKIVPVMTAPNKDGTIRVILLDTLQQRGKSELAKRLATWLIAEHGQSVGVICYDQQKLAHDHSRKMRRLLRSPEALAIWPHLGRPLPNADGASDALHAWSVPHRDEIRPPPVAMFAGRDGGLEGQVLHGVVLDDLYRSVDDCASLASRRTVDDQLRTSVIGRVQARGGWVFDIGTRRGAADTKGWWAQMAKEMEAAGTPLDITHLSYPIRGSEPWRHGPEGYLTPDITPEWEAAARANFGQQASTLLDQQPPEHMGGLYPAGCLGHTYEGTPEAARYTCSAVYLTVDGAETEGGGDHTVIQAWGIRGAASLLLDQRRGQWGDLEVVQQVREAIAEWRPNGVLVEETSSGKVALAALRRSVPGVVGVKVSGKGSKRERIQGTILLWAQGQVLLPEPTPEAGWCYHRDRDGLDLRGRLARLRGDLPNMRGEVDDEADAATIFLTWRLTQQDARSMPTGTAAMLLRRQGGR